MSNSVAIVLGVGAVEGIGGALCLRAASAGHHVVMVGRTREKLEVLKATIETNGGSAEGHLIDLSQCSEITNFFDLIDRQGGNLDFVAYNAGNSFRHETKNMSAAFYEEAWRICCLGGFVAGQAAANRMAANGGGSIIFTGATASVKARPPFIAFAAAKAALRATAAGLAREYGPKSVHVSHVIIDGGVDGDRRRKRLPKDQDPAKENELLSPTAIAESYWQLHGQHPSAWSFEVDLRPFNEVF